MPTTYAATAWQRLQRFDTVDAEAMQAFIAAYHGIDNHPRPDASPRRAPAS
jgi:hypothetical protein